MELNLLIIGCLFIATLFSVGESVYKHFKINKYFLLLFLGLLFVGMFLPPVQLFGFQLYFESLIFPFFICFVLLFRVKKFSRFLLLLFLCVLCSMLYSLAGIEEMVYGFVEPYMILALLLGILVGLISFNLPSAISALFFGLNIGSVLFYFTKFESFENFYISEVLFSCVLISVFASAIVVFVKDKIAFYKQNQFEKFL